MEPLVRIGPVPLDLGVASCLGRWERSLVERDWTVPGGAVPDRVQLGATEAEDAVAGRELVLAYGKPLAAEAAVGVQELTATG